MDCRARSGGACGWAFLRPADQRSCPAFAGGRTRFMRVPGASQWGVFSGGFGAESDDQDPHHGVSVLGRRGPWRVRNLLPGACPACPACPERSRGERSRGERSRRGPFVTRLRNLRNLRNLGKSVRRSIKYAHFAFRTPQSAINRLTFPPIVVSRFFADSNFPKNPDQKPQKTGSTDQKPKKTIKNRTVSPCPSSHFDTRTPLALAPGPIRPQKTAPNPFFPPNCKSLTKIPTRVSVFQMRRIESASVRRLKRLFRGMGSPQG